MVKMELNKQRCSLASSPGLFAHEAQKKGLGMRLGLGQGVAMEGVFVTKALAEFQHVHDEGSPESC